MLLAGLLVAAAVAAPLAPPAEAFTAAFGAGDVPRMMRLWSERSPSRLADRKRLSILVTDGSHHRFTAAVDEARGVLCLDLYDATELIEQYELHFRAEEGVWRAWSLRPAPTTATIPRARELLHRASISLRDGNLGEGREAALRAAELADRSGHAPTRAWAQRSLGYNAFVQGDLDAAARHYQLSVDIARAAGDGHGVGRGLDNLAGVDMVTGHYARAESRFAEALQTFVRSGHPGMAAYMVNGLGNVRSTRGDRAGALPYFENALAMFEELRDLDGTSTMLNNVGLTMRGLGRYREAIPLLTRAVELSRERGDLQGIAFAQTNLANALEMDGRLSEAMAALQDALALVERLGRADSAVIIHVNAGDLYRVLGDLDQAREHYERSRAIAEKIGFRAGLAVSLRNIANVRMLQGDLRGARALQENVLAVVTELGNRATVALAHHDLGQVHLRMGDRGAARRSFEKSYAVAEEIGDRESMLISLNMQSEVADEPERALALSRRALEMAAALGIADRLWQSYLAAGRALRRAGRLADARTYLDRAVSIVEEMRAVFPGEEAAQQRAFETVVAPYHEMVRVLVELGDVAAALEYAERAKGRVLLDVLRHGRPDRGAILRAEERAREAELSAALAELNRRHRAALVAGREAPELAEKLRKARLEYEAFLMRLHAAHPRLRIESGDIAPARLDDVAALLAGGSADAFIELVVTDERTYVFTITEAGARVHTIEIARRELEEDVRRFRELLAARDVAYAAAARTLYDLLLRPVAARLHGAKTVGFVADGPLWELPFQALQSGPGEFVLDRHALFYVPSLTVLREMASRPRSRGALRLLAFGNPVMGGAARPRDSRRGASLAPLPQSETEVRAIAALYDARHSRVLLRGDAREEVVKREAATFDVLHFATHGVLDDQNALYSRLVFSPPAAAHEDGLLEAREIMRLDLNAELAVLSACDTARGRVGAGEGLIGMSWALFVAGVPTTVVSQWKVDSGSTAELMVEFHRGLRASGRTKAEALRRAALKTRATYRHPFYWAPFVVVGDPR